MDITSSTYSAFSALSAPPPPPSSDALPPATEDLLAFLDSDGSGDLSASEIAADAGLSNIISDDVFATADADGDGVLSASELASTKPDGPPPPPPASESTTWSSVTSGADAASVFESLIEASDQGTTYEFASSIENALGNAQNMYDFMQDLLSPKAA